jgi:hypothetical protein
MPDIEHLNMKIDWSVLTETKQITLHSLLRKAHSACERKNFYADLLMEQQEQM